MLGLGPHSKKKSEWLACGDISKRRHVATWPFINGKLFINEWEYLLVDEKITLLEEGAAIHNLSGNWQNPGETSHYLFDRTRQVYVQQMSSGGYIGTIEAVNVQYE